MKQFFFEEAPGKLLSVMVDFLPMVQKFEAKFGSDNPQVKFYRKMMETLRSSLIYMNDVQYIYNRNHHLEEINELLTERLRTVQNRLALYEEIRANIDNDAIARMESQVRQRMAEIPDDPSFLTGKEANPVDVMKSYRRYVAMMRMQQHEEQKQPMATESGNTTPQQPNANNPEEPTTNG